MVNVPSELKGKSVDVAGHRGHGRQRIRAIVLAREDVELLVVHRGEVDLRNRPLYSIVYEGATAVVFSRCRQGRGALLPTMRCMPNSSTTWQSPRTSSMRPHQNRAEKVDVSRLIRSIAVGTSSRRGDGHADLPYVYGEI